MAEGANIKVVLDSLMKARKYSDEKNYGRAFAHYLVVFQLLEPSARREYEKEFAAVLHLWGSILHRRGKFEDVFRCYHLATSYFPNSVEILNNLGVHALKLKCFSAAKVYFENALTLDSSFLPAEQNLQSTRYALVERWHFPMLNDITRNKSYAQAIFLEISHGFNNILDIGMGTGILSLFASKSQQCKTITACDYSDTMFDIAKVVLEVNGVTNIKLVKKRSTNLVIPGDMKRKATLLVTEILDSGVFGENILETLIHAWDHLLNPFPYGRVIPAGVCLYITGIQSREISRKVRYISKENNILKLNDFCLYRDTEPYDTENLRTTDVTYMTDTQKCLFVDFNNILQLKMIIESLDVNPRVKLRCIKNGRIDSFAVWFTLHLNNNISLTNDPRESTQTCWEQAIINLRHPLPSVINEPINLQMSCIAGQLDIAECEQSIMLEGNLKAKPIPKCYEVTKDEIFFLNDNVLMNQLEQISNHLSIRFKDCDNLTVLDVSPFPVLGFLLAQRGAHLTCRVRNSEIAEELRINVCVANNIDLKNVKFVSVKDFNEYTNEDLKFDVIFQNLVSPCGLLYESEFYQAQVMRFSLSHRGIYLPQNVSVWAQLVECDWLNQATRVDDKNICGFKIAQLINEYKSTEQRDMNFNSVYHISLSEPQKLGQIKYNITNQYVCKTKIPIIRSGKANAVFYWFEIDIFEGIGVNTRSEESFANNASFVFDVPIPFNIGDITNLALKQHKGILKIFISEPD